MFYISIINNINDQSQGIWVGVGRHDRDKRSSGALTEALGCVWGQADSKLPRVSDVGTRPHPAHDWQQGQTLETLFLGQGQRACWRDDGLHDRTSTNTDIKLTSVWPLHILFLVVCHHHHYHRFHQVFHSSICAVCYSRQQPAGSLCQNVQNATHLLKQPHIHLLNKGEENCIRWQPQDRSTRTWLTKHTGTSR